MSLAQAFVAFLQTESAPKQPVKLPLKGEETPPSSAGKMSTTTPSSGRSTPTSAMPTLGVVHPNFSANNHDRSASASPLLLGHSTGNTMTQSSAPTFNVNRSSSSILRQVLQEENSNQQ